MQRARVRAEAQAEKRAARLRRETEREARRRADHVRNRGFACELAARELARDGGRMPVYSGGWVAYRGHVFDSRTFDPARADAEIDNLSRSVALAPRNCGNTEASAVIV
jgi:hypothetical protein